MYPTVWLRQWCDPGIDPTEFLQNCCAPASLQLQYIICHTSKFCVRIFLRKDVYHEYLFYTS